jgi:hypothetical protein
MSDIVIAMRLDKLVPSNIALGTNFAVFLADIYISTYEFGFLTKFDALSRFPFQVILSKKVYKLSFCSRYPHVSNVIYLDKTPLAVAYTLNHPCKSIDF